MKIWNMLITLTLFLLIVGCSDDESVETFQKGNYIPVKDSVSSVMVPDPSNISAKLPTVTVDSLFAYSDTMCIYVVKEDSAIIYQNKDSLTAVTTVENGLSISKGILGLTTDSAVTANVKDEIKRLIKKMEPMLDQHLDDIDKNGYEDSLLTLSIGEVTQEVSGSILSATFNVTGRVFVRVKLMSGVDMYSFNADYSVTFYKEFETLAGTIPPTHWPAIQ